MPDVRVVITDFDLDQIGDEWEDLTNTGREIVDAHDRNRWALGDLGLKVVRRYGEESLAMFADDIKKVRRSTMYDYCRVSKFFPRPTRDQFPALSWSHYRDAARLEKLDDALSVLTESQDKDRSVEKQKAVVNKLLDEPAPATKVAEFVGIAVFVAEKSVLFGFDGTPPQLPLDAEYVVRVYARGKESEDDASSEAE